MKRLSALNLTPHSKEWMKRHYRDHRWSIEDIRKDLKEKLGEDVDPKSIKAFVTEKEWLPVNVMTRRKQAIAHEQEKARLKIDKRLEADSEEAEDEGDFDPKSKSEGKQKAIRAINLRRGQREFRKKLLDAYSRKCAITGCDCVDALEAAHISPYKGKNTNHIQNGLLLRSDIHTLFDLGRIGVNVRTNRVLIARSLQKTEYGSLKGSPLQLPARKGHYPTSGVS